MQKLNFAKFHHSSTLTLIEFRAFHNRVLPPNESAFHWLEDNALGSITLFSELSLPPIEFYNERFVLVVSFVELSLRS